MNKLEDRSGPGQGTSTDPETTNGHPISPPGNPMKGNNLEEHQRQWRDELNDLWRRRAQEVDLWKQYAEVRLRDTMAVNDNDDEFCFIVAGFI